MRLLIAEDEKDLNRIISKRLESEGYTVDRCYDGGEALDYLRTGEFDAVIMDIMMPVMSGLDVLRCMRNEKDNTPVLLLTAKDSIADRVIGLDAGAQDYLVKPFAFEELLARIRVITRNACGSVSDVFEIADLSLDAKAHKVTRNGVQIILSAKEFDILEYMIRNKETVLSREKIENHVWNFDYSGGTNVVDVYIRYLRKKIDDNFDKKLIHTIRGKGYILREEI